MRDEALLRVDADRLEQLFKPVIKADVKASARSIAKGLNASPGAAVGKVVFSADEAEEQRRSRGASHPGSQGDHA